MSRAILIVAAVLLLGASLPAQDAAPDAAQKDEAKKEVSKKTQLTVQVLDQKQQPVPDAHVIVRFKEPRLLRDKRVSWEAKTNRKGVVVLSDIPKGGIKVQVIARGFQTYGDEHELSQAEEQVTILLKSPTDQVSAY